MRTEPLVLARGALCVPLRFRKSDIFLPRPLLSSIFVLNYPIGDSPLVRVRRTQPARPAPRSLARGASSRAIRESRAQARIVNLLNRGLSIAEIADREGVSERGMRKNVRAILARRAPQPPAEFLALQVSRLNEALLIAYDAMSVVNLEAVDRVVKIVRELDRYHGFAAEAATPRPARLAPPSSPPLALEGPGARMEQLAPQPTEIAQFASRNGAPSR
jgi:DNA-binding CsgD family transcriptional regulator